MRVRAVSAGDPGLAPVLAVTPQGIEIRNPLSGWPFAAAVGLAAAVSGAVVVAGRPPALGFGSLVLTGAAVARPLFNAEDDVLAERLREFVASGR